MKSAGSGKPRVSSPASAALFKSLASRIDPQSVAPLSQQICSLLRDAIETGRLQPGERLPPERSLMQLLGVSRGTLRNGLSDLIDRGYLSATQGRGNFVLEPPRSRELRILALESFRSEILPGPSLHYGWIDEAAQAVQARVHYRYMPTVDEFAETLQAPPAGYDGLLVFRATPEFSTALAALPDKLVEECPVPVVVIGRMITKTNLNTVVWDFHQAAAAATSDLLELGYRRIGFIGGPPAKGHAFDDFFQGYLASLRAAGVSSFKEDWFFREGPLGVVIEESNRQMARFLGQRRFDAVVVALVAEPFADACQRAGITSPDDLPTRLVSEELSFTSASRHWQGYAEPSAAMVRRGLEVLADVCRGVLPTGQQVIFPAQRWGAAHQPSQER